jgi:hypothetical protein
MVETQGPSGIEVFLYDRDPPVASSAHELNQAFLSVSTISLSGPFGAIRRGSSSPSRLNFAR